MPGQQGGLLVLDKVQVGRHDRAGHETSVRLTIPMKITRNIGTVLLAAYLVLVGLSGVFGIHLGEFKVVYPLLALSAGVCLLIGK